MRAIPLSPCGRGREPRERRKGEGLQSDAERAWSFPTTRAVFQPQARLAPHPALRATLSLWGRLIYLKALTLHIFFLTKALHIDYTDTQYQGLSRYCCTVSTQKGWAYGIFG